MAVADSTRPTRCLTCGVEFPTRVGKGRKARYCSVQCRSVDRTRRHQVAHPKVTRPRPLATCVHCGRSFETQPREPRRCCSAACVAARQAASRERQRRPRVCVQCGCAFYRKQRGPNDSRRFCTKNCAGMWHRAGNTVKRTATREARREARTRRTRACRVCSQPFIYGNSRRRICSPECITQRARAQWRKVYRRRHALQPRLCRECRETFKPTRGTHRFCSPDCQRRRRRRNAKRTRRIYKAVRRARTRGAEAEHIDPIAVFTRDRWRCQLCGCPTPKRLRGQMVDRAPELDHIVPLSRGGAHTWANTQCACRKCNGEKNNKTLGQLRCF